MIKGIKQFFLPKRDLVEFLLISTALFGFYLIIAWFSYSPFDSAWAVSSFQTETLNKAGAFGAWLIDLFFTFFGQVGNIIPFVLLVSPLYFLHTKRTQGLSWTRFFLRIFGFITLLMGLTILATLMLANTTYHLSGGVLGGSLVVSLYPLFSNQFPLIIIGCITSIIGFIFCSGASLFYLVMNCYDWITMKDKGVASVQQADAEPTEQELEEIIIASPFTEQKVEDNQAKEQESNLVNINNFINIQGLPDEENQDEQKKVTEEEIPNLAEPILVEKNEVVDITQTLGNLDQQDLVIPTVSLPTEERDGLGWELKNELEQTALSDDKHVEDSNMDELASQFSAFKQQRLDAMEQRAKEIGAEDTLKVILSNDVNQDENLVEETAENNTVAQSAVNYKPYGNSLIHPALQQPVTVKEKPSTPLPSLDLLERRTVQAYNITQDEILETSQRIMQQLRNFNVKAEVRDVLVGPVVTRYELELQPGVKASKVTSIDTDLARALMFRSIRIAEVIPGKPYIGIETPNLQRQIVPLRDVLDSDEFRQSEALLPMALGKDISGKPVIVDLAKMPHLLVAGSTGSGKSVGVNTMILSLLFRVKPEEVKFIMIDPKVVELSVYNGIPHLLTEVVTDMKKAANALRWCVDEMERRYQLLSALRVRNIEGYNEKIAEYEALNMPIPNPLWRPGDTMDTLPPPLEKLSYIVLIVDEFADLMMVAGKQIEELIARLAQKARAIGIHLILATQRPSVDVITGLIKANIPSRIAFTVASKIDSRTILDQGGAEALLGRGDMLYSAQGSSELLRVHGAFMSDDEVVRIADDWRARGKPNYIDSILESAEEESADNNSDYDSNGDLDDLFDEVVEFVVNTGITSASYIQRRFRVGFNRASRIMDQLEEQGIVSPPQQQKNGKREVLARKGDY
ncbi:cell division protein FtsK [Canicola haemoglobinophilus]|uniref:DNA translocase FtsK n=1 Tax=Canicola haemoglobinophilus TaxID=733 RepID=A0A1V4AZT1_9PAST|nr:DNA translocase FtsK 4TM domain-containing protein [Canicola haemoglobinophilus]OOR98821.1 cell division protein FtsK [Canicola haemoglobinophilus]STO60944.1 DNA translocase FtsK [Canicola haemoglobinophilus]